MNYFRDKRKNLLDLKENCLKFKGKKISLFLNRSRIQSKYKDRKLTNDDFMRKEAIRQAFMHC